MRGAKEKEDEDRWSQDSMIIVKMWYPNSDGNWEPGPVVLEREGTF